MNSRRVASVASALLACWAVSALAAPPKPDALAQLVVEGINTQSGAAIHSASTPALREALPVQRLETLFGQVHAAVGHVSSATAEPHTGHPGKRSARYRLSGERGAVLLSVSWDAEGLLAGLSLRPPPEQAPPVARSTGPLRLPFEGRWTVVWGGSTEADNYHVTNQQQRRAADLVITDEEGNTHRGDGSHNAHYYCYGKPVLSVSTGRVAFAVDGVPDNVPGSMNGYMALGNAVFVANSDGTLALYAHLIRGSLQVKAGQAVEAGALLGRCGNSGRSSEPHLHFHLQDAEPVQEGWGVEAVFQGVELLRDGKTTTPANYTFKRDDTIQPLK